MAEAIGLTSSEHRRLVRLAREANCSVREVLRDVLRDGFDYTEYKIKAVNEGLSDVAAGRMVSLDYLKERFARNARAKRG